MQVSLISNVGNYCLADKINTNALSKTQSDHRSSSDPFKPILKGFESAHAGKILSKGGEQ